MAELYWARGDRGRAGLRTSRRAGGVNPPVVLPEGSHPPLTNSTGGFTPPSAGFAISQTPLANIRIPCLGTAVAICPLPRLFSALAVSGATTPDPPYRGH